MPGLCTLHARVRPPLSSSLDVAGADASGQPPGALSGALVRESGAYLQPRSRIVDQHAALVLGWDVFCWLGHRRFARHWSVPQLRAELKDTHQIRLSDDAIMHYIGLYQTMLAARQQDPARLAEAYRDIESLVLTIDGLQPEKGP